MSNPQTLLKYLKSINMPSQLQLGQIASRAKIAWQKGRPMSGKALLDPHLPKPYRPTLYLSHPFFQSLYNITEPKKSLVYSRERLFLEDGGHVCLDWAPSLRLRGKHFEEYQPEETAPIFFVMHGLTGGS